MGWPRLSLVCAVIAILSLTAPASFAQEPSERAETTLTFAPFAAGYLVGVDWLGPFTRSHVVGGLDEPLNFDGPWQGRGAMVIEQRLGNEVLRAFWPAHVADPRADAIINGLARYMQTRAMEKVFDLFYLRTAHSVESRPYFGGHVIWSFPPLQLSRHAVARRDRYASVFDSLERWIGTPALQAACYQVAHIPDDRLTADTIIKTVSDSAGQDLSWAFTTATADVDYIVDSITDTSVTVARRGAAPVPAKALTLKVAFADGEPVIVNWGGSEPSQTFQFSGPSKVVAAYLDPDRIIASDRNHLNNSIVTPQPTNVPVRKWAARWMVWLQHTMLSYGFLA